MQATQTVEFPAEIAERYTVVCDEDETGVRILGVGAYGEVILVEGKKHQHPMALKCCFDCLIDDCMALKRMYREISVLRQLHHENIVALKDIVLPKRGCDVYLAFELAQHDLEHAIRYNLIETPRGTTRVSFDIANALSFLHRAGLMHRDVKPSNILLTDCGRAKLCDFGFVRRVGGTLEGDSKALTEYVGMRWYRAPELLIGANYDQSIDVTLPGIS